MTKNVEVILVSLIIKLQHNITLFIKSMILYNVTLRVDEEIHDDWVQWMKAIHIADVMKTGLFIDYRMSRMLSGEPGDAPTYTIQYRLENEQKLETYQSQFASGLQNDHMDRYGDKVLAFRSLMEVIDEGTNADL